ncbi:hypothetical protein [Porphyromonas somerae]|uniref:hypothetical protein n=1 Tax=Porphyromonas somerae TaxID=322095 RepID=UPI002A7F75B6|nr:hypothetical protein [Porphyromonas somerae]MDY3884861.1 hypothetical protein [Porphyromonas somerae]
MVNGQMVGIDLVFCPNNNEDDRRLSIAIPPSLVGTYKLLLQARMLKLDLRIDALDEYQSATGIFLHKVIIRAGDGAEREGWFYTLSDMGEVSYCRVPIYLAVMYAVLHQLPVMVEDSLLEKDSPVASLDDIQKQLSHSAPMQLSKSAVLQLMIDQEEANHEFLSRLTDEELKSSLSIQELKEIKEKVVEMEKYEWAKRFAEIIEQKEGDEK